MTAALLSTGDFLAPPPDSIRGSSCDLMRGFGVDAIEPLQAQLSGVLAEMDAMRAEVEALRSRDQAINFYMQRIDDELRLAARLQQDFLPKSLPQVGGVRFHALFRPAGYVSGDFYDVMRLDEQHVGFYLADAVGHGMPAALLTMFIKNALVTKEVIENGYRLLSPGHTMAKLNNVLVEQNLSHATFATALYGLINTQTGEVSFARGGHPSPVILRADGSVETPTVDGCLLGIFEKETFADCAVKLFAGDRLFLFTDGIEVALSGEKVIDSLEWGQELQRLRGMSSQAMLDHFSTQMEQATGSLEPKDDLTIIVIEMQGE